MLDLVDRMDRLWCDAADPPRWKILNNHHLVAVAVVFRFFLLASAAASVHGDYFLARAVTDEVLAQTRIHPERSEAAFRFLRVFAEGRAEEISGDLLLPFRLRQEVADPLEWNRACSRELAFLAIGKLGSPVAQEYLDGITEEQFSEEVRSVLWPTVRIARYEWKLAARPDARQRVEFLVSILRARRENDWEWAPEGWALDELCVIGDIGSLAELEAAIHSNVDASQREQTLRLCRDIAYLVSSESHRVAALSSALQIEGTKFNEPLLTWVISELGRMRTTESRAALEGFRSSRDRTGSYPRGGRSGFLSSRPSEAASAASGLLRIHIALAGDADPLAMEPRLRVPSARRTHEPHPNELEELDATIRASRDAGGWHLRRRIVVDAVCV
jgi:hypothetical protein